MLHFLLILFLSFIPFSISYAEKKQISLVTNFSFDPVMLNDALHKRKISDRVILSDLSEYRDPLKKQTSGWSKFLCKFSINPSPPLAISENLSKVVFWNITPHYTQRMDLEKFPKEKLILFMWEPPTVLPKMYLPKTISFFPKIYTWDDDLVDNKTFFKFYYPVLQPMIQEIPLFEEKKLCTMVCSNLSSKHPDELYSERKKTIAYFEQAQESGFEFYGKGWNAAEHPSYLGSMPDKIPIIKNYRFSICYENIQNIKGYITEKIFDCFAAGNVPVYWGASNIDRYIPQDCYIDRRNFSSLEELHVFLKNMNKEEYEGYLTRIQTFLKSEQAQLFSWEHFAEVFCRAVTK
jgi:hypothetical protein